MKEEYTFSARTDVFSGEGGWIYVYVPVYMSEEINHIYSEYKRGFGSIKVEARINETKWKTSIFYDSSSKQFILFLKREVRIKESIEIDSTIKVKIKILVDM